MRLRSSGHGGSPMAGTFAHRRADVCSQVDSHPHTRGLLGRATGHALFPGGAPSVSGPTRRFPAVRLIVARCEVRYSGRLSAVLPEALRLLMIKSDGTFMVWADGGGQKVKPLNWMTPPTVIEADEDGIV